MLERRFLIAFFVYLVIEGVFRKWLLPSFSSELFLAKDLLVLIAVVAYLGKKISNRTYASYFLTKSDFLLVCGWVIFIIGNFPMGGFNLTSVVGLRYYLVMIPVMLLLPNIITDLPELNRLASKYLWLSLPITLLGFLQYFSSPDALVNRYAWQSGSLDVATIGSNNVRITGTFPYIAPYAVYLQFMLLIALAQFNLSICSKSRFQAGIIAALLFINIIMTGSRAPFVISIVLAVPFLVGSLKKASGNLTSVVTTFLLVGMFFYLLSSFFSTLSVRNSEAQDSNTRIWGALLAPIVTIDKSELIGMGLGSTFMGLREAGSSDDSVGFDEVSVDRIGIELGTIGYLFIVVFKCAFLVKALTFFVRAVNRTIKTWALVVFSCQVMFLWSIPVYNSVAAAYYFASIGLYFFLRKQSTTIDANVENIARYNAV